MNGNRFLMTADFAFESCQTTRISQSSTRMKDQIHISSAAFPDRSMCTAKPLEIILAARDSHHEHTEKFILPVEASANCSLPQFDCDSKSQNISEQILQVQT
jgi:hypothetical protein